MSDIIRRIERKVGVKDIASLLGDQLDPTDLQSLMLEVYRRVVQRRTPRALLAYYKSNRFSQPVHDPAALAEYDQTAFREPPPGF